MLRASTLIPFAAFLSWPKLRVSHTDTSRTKSRRCGRALGCRTRGTEARLEAELISLSMAGWRGRVWADFPDVISSAEGEGGLSDNPR